MRLGAASAMLIGRVAGSHRRHETRSVTWDSSAATRARLTT